MASLALNFEIAIPEVAGYLPQTEALRESFSVGNPTHRVTFKLVVFGRASSSLLLG
jgi:hypothetical protein